jgi:glycosyltransferase involved in cell wall biosynthesis
MQTLLPFISVITAVRNEQDRIKVLLDALEEQTYPHNRFEVIVIDDASTDQTCSIVRKYGFCHLIELKEKSNQYAALNMGATHAKGDIFLITDGDCIPEKTWIESGIKKMQETKADICGGNINLALPQNPSGASFYDSFTFLQQEDLVRRRRVAATANIFVTRTVWEACNGLNTGFGYNGDIDFVQRTQALGYKLEFAEKASVTHPTRSAKALLKKSYFVGIGKGVHYRKHRDKTNKKSGEISQSLPLLALHIWPSYLLRRLKHRYPYISYIRFIDMILWAYLCFFAAAIGICVGLLSGKRLSTSGPAR